MERIRKLAAFSVLVIITVSGCALHRPQRIEPPVAAPDSFLEDPGTAAALDSVGCWWPAFGDSMLDSLMQAAFARNLYLEQAYARLEQSVALARTGRAARFPQVEAGGRASRDKQLAAWFGGTGNTYSLSATAGFELDLWQKLKSRDRAAAIRAQASREDLSTLYLGISAQVADLYYLIVEQRAQLELTERTIASYREILEIVQRRYTEGIAPAIDIYQARQNLSMALAARPLYEAGLASAEHALSVLLGDYPHSGFAGELTALPEMPAAFPAGLPSELLLRRPDVKAAMLRAAAGDAEIGAALAERFPSINLLGSYGSYRSIFGSRDISGTVWNLVASLAMPLFDGGRRRAETDRTRAAYREALAAYQQTVLEAFKEVEDALAANRTTEERIRRIEERVQSTSAMLRLAVENYSQGLTAYLPVLTAQSLDYETRSRLLSARRRLISDRISLARALGGNWMDEESSKRFALNSAKGQAND